MKGDASMGASVGESLQELENLFQSTDEFGIRDRQISSLREAARQQVREGKDPYLVYDEYLHAENAYVALLRATNENSWDMSDNQLKAWRHQSIPLPRYKSHSQPYVSPREVDDAVASYLRSDIRCDHFDRSFMDAIIASEILAFFDHPGSKVEPRKWHQLILDYAIIAVLILLSQGAWWAWLISLCLFLYPLVTAYLARDARKRVTNLVQEMMDTYRCLNGAMTSTRELRRALENSRDAGAVWLSSTWALLEDVERRKTTI